MKESINVDFPHLSLSSELEFKQRSLILKISTYMFRRRDSKDGPLQGLQC